MLGLALMWHSSQPRGKVFTLRNVVDYHRALWTFRRKIGMDRSSNSSFANWERSEGCATNVAYPHAKPGKDYESLRGATFFLIDKN